MNRLQGVTVVRKTLGILCLSVLLWHLGCHAPRGTLGCVDVHVRAIMAVSPPTLPFHQQLLQQTQKMSLVAQCLCGLIVLFYLLGFLPKVDENVAVTPA